MIEKPPLLTIKRPNRRPSPEQIAGFQGVPTSFVVDAMQGGQVMDHRIRPLGEGRDLTCVAAGPALTVDSGPADVLGLLAAAKFVQSGDVVVNATGGHTGCASAGDRICGMLRNAGAAGLVTDGLTRDYDGMVAAELPLWCRGLSPNTPYDSGPARIGLPVDAGGLRIETGDMVIADRDGVVVVPFARIAEVLEALQTVTLLEKERDTEVAAGLVATPGTEALLASDQVKYLDGDD